MTQPLGSGAPTPVQGVTGGPGLPQGVASIDGTTGNVQISAPSNTTQFKKGAVPQSLQIYEFDGGPTSFARISLSAQTNGPFLISVDTNPPATIRDLTIQANGVVIIGSTGSNPLAFRTSNTTRWQINATGHFNPITDNAYDIGTTTGPFRPKNIILAGFLSAIGGLQFGNSTIIGVSMFSGSGAPAITPADGSFYFRSDGAALTTIYQRRAGAWVGIV